MIALRSIDLYRGGRPLLEDVSLTFYAGQKIGVTGANGSGKSSLFALLLGGLHPERGDIDLPARLTVAHVAQETPALDTPALDFVLEGDAEVSRLEREMTAAESTDDGVRLAALHHEYEARDGWRARSRAATILHGLGFSGADQSRMVREFSGGWRVRLNVARALMCPSDLLLLDEPTNHLDLDAVIWLEDWLRAYPGTLLLISHDRDFLDNVVEHIAHIEHRRITLYTGNYAQFERTRAERLSQQQAAHDRQQREIAHIQSYVERFRAQATKARQAQSRLKALARMEIIAAAEADSPFNFSIPAPERCPDPLLVLKGAATGYDGKAVLSGVDLSLTPGTRLGVLGRNGAGKSTLLRLIAGEAPCLAGERIEAKYLACGYFVQHQLEKLRANESPLEHLQRLEPQTREQELRDFIGGFDFRGDDARRAVATFSGGERTRLALALLVRQRPNLLILDEPTNHLDLLMRDALTRALQDYPGALVVISHDRYLLRAVTDEFLLVADGRARPFDGDLDDYRAWLARTDPGADMEPADDPAHGAAARREQKRAEAERRNALHRARRPLEQRIRTIEAELDRLHAEQQAVQGEIADPALYAGEKKSRLQAILARDAEIKARLAEVEGEWLTLGEEIEALG